MDDAYYLGRAQDQIQNAMLAVSAVQMSMSSRDSVGTSQMDYLAQSMTLLNNAWALIRAGVNPDVPGVRMIPTAGHVDKWIKAQQTISQPQGQP